jgi:hypothetical protein
MGFSRRSFLLSFTAIVFPISRAFAIDACTIPDFAQNTLTNLGLASAGVAFGAGLGAGAVAGLAIGGVVTVGAITITPAILVGVAVGATVVAALSLWGKYEVAELSKDICKKSTIKNGLMLLK